MMKNKSKEALDDMLNIAADLVEEESVVGDLITYETDKELSIDVKEPSDKANDLEADYIKSRDTLRGLLDKSEKALERILFLASTSEQPRVLEVASGLIKTIADVSKDLIQLQKLRNEVENPGKGGSSPAEGAPGNTGNTTIYVGSTADLSKAIRKEEKEIIDVDNKK